MADQHFPHLHMDQPACYSVWVQGAIDERWRDWFDRMEITPTGDDTTILRGSLSDQAALLGFLQRLYTLGYPILKVEISIK